MLPISESRESYAPGWATDAVVRALILGARASEIEQAGELSIQGNRRRAHAFLNTLTGPPRLAAVRQQLEAAADT